MVVSPYRRWTLGQRRARPFERRAGGWRECKHPLRGLPGGPPPRGGGGGAAARPTVHVREYHLRRSDGTADDGAVSGSGVTMTQVATVLIHVLLRRDPERRCDGRDSWRRRPEAWRWVPAPQRAKQPVSHECHDLQGRSGGCAVASAQRRAAANALMPGFPRSCRAAAPRRGQVRVRLGGGDDSCRAAVAATLQGAPTGIGSVASVGIRWLAGRGAGLQGRVR